MRTNTSPARRTVLALAAMVVLALVAQTAPAAENFQLHVENRLAPTPTTHPGKRPASTQPRVAPQWSTDLSLALNQPFSATFTEGRTATSIEGTVRKTDHDQFRISISVKRVITEDWPGQPVPMLDVASFQTSIDIPLSKEQALGGVGPADAVANLTCFVTLSPKPPHP